MPKRFQNLISTQSADGQKPAKSTQPCDCADTNSTCQAGKNSGLKNPKLLKSADPDFSKEARENKISGSVEVGIRIAETGAIADEWIVREFGSGLDEEAANAVSQYKFAPATCHGTPIGMTFSIEVNFQIH